MKIRVRAGFTLLEVIVAIGILAVIAGMTFSTLANAFNTRDLLESEDATNQSARVALDRLKRDLSLAWLTPQKDAVNSFKTIFVAHNSDPDSLWFSSLSHQRLYRDARECDETEITYWTESDPEMRGAYVLMHREAQRIDNEPEKDGEIYPLAYHVKDFQVRFINPKTNEWTDEWDSTGADTPYELPRGAHVLLSLYAPDPDDPAKTVERVFATTVTFQFGNPLKRNVLDGGTGDAPTSDPAAGG